MWSWFRGKKTKIGMALVLLAQAGRAFAPDLAPWELIEQAGIVIGGIGLAAPIAEKTVNKISGE